jgi:trimethylamine:corrinoid methyltransferase-like protein
MTVQSNYLALDTPHFRKLSEDQLERLHHASLEILDHTRVRLFEPKALELLNWYPQLFDRRNYDDWKSRGAKSLRQRAREKALKILETHISEPLPTHIQKQLDEIAEKSGDAQHP